MEWKLFEGETSEFITKEWYEPRDAAHHLEDGGHVARLEKALEYLILLENAHHAAGEPIRTISDIGCGDGGMLQLIKDYLPRVKAWGYDLAPNNIEHAVNVRGVDARYTDFQTGVEYGDISIYTEVLEHVVDPVDVLKKCESKYVVASSPRWETGDDHYEFHLWAWDEEGYASVFERAGYEILAHEGVTWSQVVTARKL